MNTKEWEKKVLKMFEQGTHANEVNQLIRSLLSSYTQEIREKVEKLLTTQKFNIGTKEARYYDEVITIPADHEGTRQLSRKATIYEVLQILESNE